MSTKLAVFNSETAFSAFPIKTQYTPKYISRSEKQENARSMKKHKTSNPYISHRFYRSGYFFIMHKI